MNDIGTLLGWISFGLLGIWRIYWHVSGQIASKAKPKARETFRLFSKKGIGKLVALTAFGVAGVQLLGISLFEFPDKSLFLQLVGFVMVVTGLGVAVVGRRVLGTNWANCYEYQVKRDQELVTTGIYHFIRHPLYLGIGLFLIGSQLVVQSYLVFLYIFGIVAVNQQAKWEEKVLIEHFGDKYRNYMKRTKRFIPFIW